MPPKSRTRTSKRGANKRQRVTIADVAKLAGVSTTTVSLVLNGRASELRISAESKERVLTACRRLGYQPNFHARRLAQLRSDTFAFLVSPSNQGRVFHLFGAMLSGVLEAASAHDLRVYVHEWGAAARSRSDYLTYLREGSIDGLITYGIRPDDLAIAELKELEAPIIFLDRVEPEWSYVTSDHVDGSRQAVEHLVKLGHRRLAFVCGPAGSSSSRRRQQGFEAAVGELLPTEPIRLIDGGFTEEAGYEAGAKLLAAHPEVTGVVCAHDYTAYGLIRYLSERGYDVPGFLSVVGANDTELARLIHPELTTVHVPMREMAMHAVAALAAMLRQDRIGPVQERLPVELVVRRSTGSPRPSASNG